MADWDSADILQRCKDMASRPSSDQAIVDARWYQLLSEAQDYWVRQMVLHCPWTLLASNATLTTGDSGLTYTFPSSIVPLWYILYASSSGPFLRPGSYDDPNADYVPEGGTIRIPRGQTRTWSGGPYARYVAPPAAITAGVAPSLTPSTARVLLVYRAVAEFFRQGGLRDPSPFLAREQELAWGVPNSGDVGIIGQIKLANPFAGMAAYAAPGLWGLAYVNQVHA